MVDEKPQYQKKQGRTENQKQKVHDDLGWDVKAKETNIGYKKMKEDVDCKMEEETLGHIFERCTKTKKE